MGGFSATPNELQQAAKAINDTIGHVAGIPWEGPSANYGHPGVQAAWGQFMDDTGTHIKGLAKAAQGHGENLQQAASDYVKFDQHAADLLGNLLSGAVGSAVNGVKAGAQAVGQGVEAVGHAELAGAQAVGHGVEAVGHTELAGAEAVGHAVTQGAENVGHAAASGLGWAGNILSGTDIGKEVQA